ncbi:MAG: ATP-dependent helicase [Opitutales bacterium]
MTSFASSPGFDSLPPIDFKAELNDEQFEAVTSPMGPALVLAGAGSGKTRTLTYRVAYLLSQGVAPWNILLLTFTNKAAREMLERVEDLTGVDRRHFWGGTFHSIGQRILRKHGESVGFEASFNIMDQDDANSMMNAVIKETDPAFLKNKNHPKSNVIHSVISYARNTGQPVEAVAEDRYPWLDNVPTAIVRFSKAYEKRKRAEQVADYDDLLTEWLKLLKENEDARTFCQTQFKCILVDEYQDTNYIQSAIIDNLTGNHNIMAVGDDAQCIYTWRGADFQNILTFPERHPGTEIYKIQTNYRSSPEILSLANAILANQPAGTGYSKELSPVRDHDITPVILPFVDQRQQARWIVNRLRSLQMDGQDLSEVAILYRAHYQAMDVQMELARSDIPFVITSGIRFFEQAHIRDVAAQLRFIANGQDSSAFFRFIKHLPKVGDRSAERIYQFIAKLARDNGVGSASIMLHKNVVSKIPANAREEYGHLARTLIDAETAMKDNASPATIVELVIEGWYQDFLRNHYENYSSREDDLQSLVNFASRYSDLNELLSELILLSTETGNDSPSNDSTDNKVRLTTVHQSKGLEFPVVIIIGCADNLFPLKRAIDDDNLDEERRLFYVAVTRAMRELFIAYPMISIGKGPPTRLTPSRFINELPSDSYDVVRTQQSSW